MAGDELVRDVAVWAGDVGAVELDADDARAVVFPAGIGGTVDAGCTLTTSQEDQGATGIPARNACDAPLSQSTFFLILVG